MPQPNQLQDMLKQAQQMQEDMEKTQAALKEERVDASAGGGMVKVVATGDGRLESITVDPGAVDPDDVELLQDMILAASNEALRAAEELRDRKMAESQGGFDPMSALDALGGLGGLGGGGGAPGGAPNRAARRAANKKR